MPLVRNCSSCGRSNRIPAKHLSDVGKCGACKAELPAIGEALEVNQEEFNEIVRESKAPVLVDFWASWWAVPDDSTSRDTNRAGPRRTCRRAEGGYRTFPRACGTIQRPQHS